jgi:hypothetical protein
LSNNVDKPTTCLVQYLKAGVITLTLLSAIDPNRFQKNQRYERCVVLSHDLNIRITPSHLDDNDFVDATLDGILKEAILDQTREKMNFAYRVGDLLGYDRPQLLWKTAQTLAMQFRYAETLSTCRELSEKFSNEQTAKLISELIELLLDQEPSIYLQLKNLSGVTSSIVEMARIAVRKSQPRDLEYHLDLFKKVELMHQIISKTDKGAYQKALESNGENPDSKFTAIFKTQHKEIGLVISSEKAVPLILAFLKDLKKVEKQVKGKGKGKDDSGDFVESGMDLVQLCHSTRNYQCCSRSIQLLLEKCVLKRVRVPEKLEETFNDALLYLLQNVFLSNLDFKRSSY